LESGSHAAGLQKCSSIFLPIAVEQQVVAQRAPGRQPAVVINPSSADDKIDKSLPASVAAPGRFLYIKRIAYRRLSVSPLRGE
jgi:hypothetical protein